jgi:HK97 family phage portal protein
MGLIARAIAERAEEVRNDSGWLARDDYEAIGPRTASGVRINRSAALGLTTIWRCVDLLSSAVSQAPKDIILKVGGRSFPEFTKPDWLVMPNPMNPAYTINDYFGQVAISLLMDGNYFVSVYPYVLDPQVLTVLDPGLVDVRGTVDQPKYDIRDRNGKLVSTLGPMEILHGTWIRPAGALRGISPLEALRQGMGNAIAAEQHAGRFFGQGAALSFGVEVPGKMDPEKQTQLRDSLQAKYAGLRRSHAIGVLTDGAKFVSGLAPTPEQAQMLATRKFGVEDLCRPYGVPPNMAGSQEPGASSYASADVWRDEFRDYAVLPLAVRLEVQHSRLAQVPDTITDPNATAQFKFNLDHVARTSLLTRYQAFGEAIRGGFKTPAQIRALEDDPPVDPKATDPSDKLYMQQQMVPIGDLGATKATEPLDTQPHAAEPVTMPAAPGPMPMEMPS